MADIFISFIHEDERVADAVKTLLHQKLTLDSAVFLASDKWAIYAGQDWLQRIKEELDSAKVLVLLLNTKSIVRPWVNFEAGAAWLANKAIIPACFGGLQKDALPKPYSNLQALSLEDADGPYYMVTSIFNYLRPTGIPPAPFLSNDPQVAALHEILTDPVLRLPKLGPVKSAG
jgi:TIR domain